MLVCVCECVSRCYVVKSLLPDWCWQPNGPIGDVDDVVYRKARQLLHLFVNHSF